MHFLGGETLLLVKHTSEKYIQVTFPLIERLYYFSSVRKRLIFLANLVSITIEDSALLTKYKTSFCLFLNGLESDPTGYEEAMTVWEDGDEYKWEDIKWMWREEDGAWMYMFICPRVSARQLQSHLTAIKYVMAMKFKSLLSTLTLLLVWKRTIESIASRACEYISFKILLHRLVQA